MAEGVALEDVGDVLVSIYIYIYVYLVSIHLSIYLYLRAGVQHDDLPRPPGAGLGAGGECPLCRQLLGPGLR